MRSTHRHNTEPVQATAPLASSLIVRDGDTVHAKGVVEIAAGHPTLICPPLPSAVNLTSGGRPYRACPGGIVVIGLDLSEVAGKTTYSGVTTGFADLTGRYRSGTLTVASQRTYMNTYPAAPDDPLCEAPAGGWPQGTADVSGNIDVSAASRFRAAHPNTIIEVGLLRPAADAVIVYVVTSGDPAPARAALTPVYGKDLCVVQSAYTYQQIQQTTKALQARMLPGSPLTSPNAVGGAKGPRDQVLVGVTVPMMTAPLAALIDAQPAGLVTESVWLIPVR